jgi:uncharacterized protein HemX
MENQNPTPPTQPTTAPIAPPVVAPPPPVQAAPVTTPPSSGKKGNGLLLVAIILVALIVVLGALYYIIIKQSGQTASVPTYPTPTPAQTTNSIAPDVSVTVTPTDDEILNSQVTDPATDATELNQAATGL